MQIALGFTLRHVRAYFVEAKRSNYAKLDLVVHEYKARGVDAVACHGPVEVRNVQRCGRRCNSVTCSPVPRGGSA
jgi:hypothetical protein